MQKTTLFIAFITLIGIAKADDHLRLQWSELSTHVVKKKTAFALPDGARLEGRVVSVEPNGLRVDIEKSSDRKTHPKGKQLIPRESLSVLEVTSYGKRGRILGTLGAAAIAGGFVAAQSIDVYEGPFVIIVPIVVAAGIGFASVGGYYIGKIYDKKKTEIWIIPEPKTVAANQL